MTSPLDQPTGTVHHPISSGDLAVTANPSHGPMVALQVAPHLQTAQAHLTGIPQATMEFKRDHVNLGDDTIRLGTYAIGNFRDLSDRLNPKKAPWTNMDESFRQLQTALQHSDPDLQRLEIDMDYGLITKIYSDDPSEDVEMTWGQAKIELAKHPELGSEEKAENFLGVCFRAFKTACQRSGVRTYVFYEPWGPDRLGSEMGKQAFEIDKRKTPQLIQRKQAITLTADQQKKSYNIGTFVANCYKGTHRAHQAECAAMGKIIQAESFLIKLQERLSSHIQTLQQNPKANAKAIRNANRILREVRGTNRHAFWMTASLIPPPESIMREEWTRLHGSKSQGTVPSFDTWRTSQEAGIFVDQFIRSERILDLCYENVLKDHYEDLYRDKTEYSRPTFDEFLHLSESHPYRQDAAEIASTLIQSPLEYRLYCKRHGIEPNAYNGNTFLNQLLMEPQQIDFSHFGKPIEEEEAQTLTQLVQGAFSDVRDTEQCAMRLFPARQITAPTGEQMLRKVLKNSELASRLADPAFKPNWKDKAASWIPWSGAVALSSSRGG